MKSQLFTQLSKPTKYFTELFSWEAPERYWTPKDRAWYVGWSFFFVLIISVGVLLQEYLFTLSIIAFAFLWFIQASIPPQIGKFKITTIGIKAYEKVFRWKDVKHFWFSIKNNVIFLNLDLSETYEGSAPGRISMMLGEGKDDEKIFEILIRQIDYGDKEEISFNFLTEILHGKHVEMEDYMSTPKEDEEPQKFAIEADELMSISKDEDQG